MTRFLPLFVLLASVAGPAAAGPAYVPGTEDVPLMRGLAPVGDRDLVFDEPQGRIVEAAATGAVKRSQVVAFYRASLPQLGWKPAGARRFEREGERLSLDFTGSDGDLLVDFTLAPQ